MWWLQVRNANRINFSHFSILADAAVLCFACNEISCSATYPSPFAQVHKINFSQMNGGIRDNDKCTWKIPSMKSRVEDLKLLKTFWKSIDEKNSKETKYKLGLEFMAQNGLR